MIWKCISCLKPDRDWKWKKKKHNFPPIFIARTCTVLGAVKCFSMWMKIGKHKARICRPGSWWMVFNRVRAEPESARSKKPRKYHAHRLGGGDRWWSDWVLDFRGAREANVGWICRVTKFPGGWKGMVLWQRAGGTHWVWSEFVSLWIMDRLHHKNDGWN